MTMTGNGLAKLIEECGELTQVAGKKLACMDSDDHFDGAGSLKARLENEIADVVAATNLVIETFELDWERIEARSRAKLAQFQAWHADVNA
jgi:hypothetical protein